MIRIKLAAATSAGPGDAGADEPVPVDQSTLAVPAPAVIAARRTFATLPNSLASSVAASHPTPITFANLQPRALSRKASDEFVVPLWRIHHRLVHRVGKKPPGGRTPAAIRSRLPGSSGTTAAWIMGGSRLARWRNVPRQIEPLTSTVRLRTAADLTSIALTRGLDLQRGACALARSSGRSAVGVRSITSDRLQIRHHRDHDRHRNRLVELFIG